MKRIDWIVLIVFVIILASAGIWYFFFRNKSQKAVIPPPPVGGNSGSTASNPAGATSQVDVSDLPYGSLPLKQGDKNQLVAILQRALNYLGAYLTVDGIFGPQTQSALIQRTGSSIVTSETALVLANQIKGQNDGEDPIADYIIEYLI